MKEEKNERKKHKHTLIHKKLLNYYCYVFYTTLPKKNYKIVRVN